MTDTPEQIIKGQYVALAKLLKSYQYSSLDKAVLQATLSFCKKLDNLAQTQPDLIFAQPQLYKSQLPLIVNLAFNACVFTCLLATRNKFDPAIKLQLMCGSISLYSYDQALIESHYQNKVTSKQASFAPNSNDMAKLLRKHQQHIWLSTFSLAQCIHSHKTKNISRLKPAGAVAFFANKLSILCTPNKLNAPINFAQAIKFLTRMSPEKFYSLITPLLTYPGLHPPGCYIQNKRGVNRVVVAIHAKGLVTKELSVKQQEPAANKEIEVFRIEPSQVNKSFTCQTLKGLSRLNYWWDDRLTNWMTSDNDNQCINPFPNILPINSAPPSLLVIQDQLKQSNADMSVLVKAIEKEPSYAQQLQKSASLSNRQKQAVNSIQHGLAMLGTERTAQLFLQHSLMSRLNQQYFPLQHSFLTFSQFFIFIVEEIIAKTKCSSAEKVKVAAYFLLSRMFTLPSLRIQLIWKTDPKVPNQLNGLINQSKSTDLKQDAVLLAHAWQQDHEIIQLLKGFEQFTPSTGPKKLKEIDGYILGVGLLTARKSYFAEQNYCQGSQSYLNQALNVFHMSQSEWTDFHNKLMIKANLSCQLL